MEGKVEKLGTIEFLSVSSTERVWVFFIKMGISLAETLIYNLLFHFFKWFLKHNKLLCNMLMSKHS